MSAEATLLLSDELIYRLTVDQYHDMIQAGTLTPDDPVELLEGVLLFKMPKNSPHSTTVRRCRREIELLLSKSFFYDSEQPVTLLDGEPEPDGIVVRGTIDDYQLAHPAAQDISLIIEVSDTTLNRDRGVKLRSYARAAIPCYWIINLIDRQIEVYTGPNPSASIPTYSVRQIVAGEQNVALVIADLAIGEIPVSSLLPAPSDR